MKILKLLSLVFFTALQLFAESLIVSDNNYYDKSEMINEINQQFFKVDNIKNIGNLSDVDEQIIALIGLKVSIGGRMYQVRDSSPSRFSFSYADGRIMRDSEGALLTDKAEIDKFNAAKKSWQANFDMMMKLHDQKVKVENLITERLSKVSSSRKLAYEQLLYSIDMSGISKSKW
jgi:hypothetical protein